MDNEFDVHPIGAAGILIHRTPANVLTQAQAFNLAAWLVAYGKRLEGGESFTATLKRVERSLDGKS